MIILEHDLVVLTRDVAAHQLRAGDVGTVIHVYEGLSFVPSSIYLHQLQV